MNKTNIFIIGAGGHTRSLLNLIDTTKYNILGILDNNFSEEEYIAGIAVRGKPDDFIKNEKVVVSAGDNMKRETLLSLYRNNILQVNLIHFTANIEMNVSLNLFNQIFARAYINSDTSIGENNIINTGCIIEHECLIGSHNHISVGAVICGRVKMGDRCFIGAGSVVIDKVSICNDVIIGANSVVIDSVTEPGTYVGNPAKRIK